MPLLSCSSASSPDAADAADAPRYVAALEAVAGEPSSATEHCAAIHSASLRADCVIAGVEQLARTDPPAAALLCAPIEAGIGRDECFFQLADKSTDPSWCADAGRFAFDCRIHSFSRALMLQRPSPGVMEPALTAQIAALGFADDDDRPWVAAYRRALSMRRPMDRPACLRIKDPRLRGICSSTGIVLLHDMLSHARDTGALPCGPGAALPAALSYTPDPELDAIVAQRRRADLCP